MQGFKNQDLKKGTTFIEVLSNCPSNWKMTPLQTNEFIAKDMIDYFPLGDIKVPKGN
jgi:2-oxoglutarate/2-oxoacid ferredoxin oxidoreductase subunit beta